MQLFFKGTPYRENRIEDYREAMESIIIGIKTCITPWCDKQNVSTSSFSEWTKAMISAIDEKINHLSTKLTTEKRKNTLKLDEKITKELKMLHNKFAVTSIDKTRVNVAFVC